MNDYGDITTPDSSFAEHSPDTIGMMYVKFIGQLQQKYDENLRSERDILLEIEKLKNLCTIQKKQSDQLILEKKEMAEAYELEKELRVQAQHEADYYKQQLDISHRIIEQLKQVQQSQPLSVNGIDEPAEADEKTTSYINKNRHKQHTINPDTVKRLKADRRHYAVACDAALAYWQKLADNELVDQYLRATPRCGVTVAARIVCCFQNVVDPDIRWSFFEKHWSIKHLQSNLNRSSYRDEKKYVLVNRIFGRPDNAPFIPKSQLANM